MNYALLQKLRVSGNNPKSIASYLNTALPIYDNDMHNLIFKILGIELLNRYISILNSE